MPFISIIVPVYNAEQFLPSCIESILNQTIKDFELILIDDGSSDCSLEICQKYSLKDNRIIVLSQENKGVSSARNAGLKRSKGKYIGFVDADDTIDKDMFRYLLDVALNAEAEMVVCGLNRISQKGTYIQKIVLEGDDVREWNKEQVMQEILAMPQTIYGYCHNKLFKKEVIKNFFEERIKIGEDLLFVFQYIKNVNKICYVPKALYNYRLYKDSTTKNKSIKSMRKFRDLLFVLWWLGNKGLKEYKIASLARSRYYDTSLWLLHETRNDEQLQKWIKKYLRKDLMDILFNSQVPFKLKILCIREVIKSK